MLDKKKKTKKASQHQILI